MAQILSLVNSEFSLDLWFKFLERRVDVEELKQWVSVDENSRNQFPSCLFEFVRQDSVTIRSCRNKNASSTTVQTSKTSKNANPRILPPIENNATRKFKPKHSSINLNDESNFPALGSAEPQTKRRINPTQIGPARANLLSPKNNANLEELSKPNPFCQAKETAVKTGFEAERALLRERKSKQQVKPRPTTLSDFIQMKDPPPLNVKITVKPELPQVTQQKSLDRLAELCTYCLTSSPQNLYSDLSLILELLLVNANPDYRSSPSKFLDSVHNCVYFSAQVLKGSVTVLLNLDVPILKLLSENARLVQFVPSLTEELSVRLQQLTKNPNRNCGRNLNCNVAFQPETDDRSNFSSDESFHAFRKQRDMFCSIWQTWKQKNSTPQWNTATNLGSQIRRLVELRTDCVNLMHLARLFRCQLLGVARLDEHETSAPLPELLNSDPEKLRRLQERLVNPPEKNVRGDFEGDLEFFRDFILLANSPAFNEALKIDLLNVILEANDKVFDGFDEAQLKADFAATLVSLKTLSKFLGILVFHPHSTADVLPDSVFHSLAELRKKELPLFDIKHIVSNAFYSQRLVITLPWIVRFLSQADPVSLSLPEYQRALETLLFVYKKLFQIQQNPATRFLVQVLLSWFFELPSFPQNVLRKTTEDLEKEFSSLPVNRLEALDTLNLVDPELLYQCCPFLSSWRAALSNFNTGLGSQQRVTSGRKITPVSAAPERKMKTIEETLQENFFNNQSPSVKKTVDFVSERLASNVVRGVRGQVILQCLSRAPQVTKEWPISDGFIVEEKIQELCTDFCSLVKKRSVELTEEASAKLKETLQALLPSDLLPPVRDVCVSLSKKMIQQKVAHWVEAHVTLDFFRSDVEAEVKRFIKSNSKVEKEKFLPKASACRTHDPLAFPPSFVLDKLKRTIRDTIDDAVQLNREDVVDLVRMLETTIVKRNDISPQIFRFFQQLSFDFLFIACVFQPEVINCDVIDSFIEFWVDFFSGPVSEDEIEYSWLIFVPRHLLFLAQTTQPRLSWDHVTSIVIRLLKKNLISFVTFEEQAVAVLQQQWPKELLERFATCLRDVVDWQRPKLSPAENEQISVELVDWLSWFCTTND